MHRNLFQFGKVCLINRLQTCKRDSVSYRRLLVSVPIFRINCFSRNFGSVQFTQPVKPLNPDVAQATDVNNVDQEKKLKILKLEVDVLRQDGHRVPNPDLMLDKHWAHAISLTSKTARRKYYSFLWQLERKSENKADRKKMQREAAELRKASQKLELDANPHLAYGLSQNTLFLRIYDTTINHWNNNRLIQAMQFGQKLVFDCSYNDHMNKREAMNAAKQLMLCFAENRVNKDPFDIHMCNSNASSTTMQYLEKYIPTMHEPWFPLNNHEQCFTELFDKKQLVYLTPHCKEDLNKFNHDDIYIVGCMVDKTNNEPLSLAKAKKLGLRMARLPLDRYLHWGSGSGKCLTLNQMTNILLDVKADGDWHHALRHVPRRKLVNSSESKKLIERSVSDHRNFDRYNFEIDKWGKKNR